MPRLRSLVVVVSATLVVVSATLVVVSAALLAAGCAPAPGDGGGDGDGGDPAGVDGGGPGVDAGSPGDAADAGGGGPRAFVHPGVIVSGGQLDFVKEQLAAHRQPWQDALARVKASPLAALDYQPHPHAHVQCGSGSMNPSVGCTDEKNDSAAAYTHALLWYLTGNSAYGKKSIAIMKAWATTLKKHSASNAPLQSAWSASQWPRAGEIIRASYDGWSDADAAAFAKMLREVYLPEVVAGSSSNGNWELSMIEATIGIAVFLDDRPTFDRAVTMWQQRVPAYIYLKSDGATPVQPPRGGHKSPSALTQFWYAPVSWPDGLSQETCRDLGHVQYGLAAISNAAETARIQGVDLYRREQKRLVAGYEFHARFLDGSVASGRPVCGKELVAVSAAPMWEIGFNALANRDGAALPHSANVIDRIRPTGNDHHMAWETITHAGVGAVGVSSLMR